MAPTAEQVLAAVKQSGVKFELMPGWDNPTIAASGHWDPQYVIQHHTANSGAGGNAPSLSWVLHDQFFPIRACHFLIGRDGTVYVVYAYKCYHAGKGGPGSWGGGPEVPLDSMNGFAFGIEVESKGTSKVESAVDGFTKAQFDALAKLDAALLDMLGVKGEGRLINHRTWAPGRKNDTLFEDSELQGNAKAARDVLNAVAASVPPYPAAGWKAFTLGQHGPHVRALQAGLGQPQTGAGITKSDLGAIKREQIRRLTFIPNGRVNARFYRYVAKPVV